ncbi:MAG: hypothetical protein M1819_000450 [Sarea resinae]|nr:MAG: hypothetical protein M1819_000450 [Sarea resinae]
MDVFVRDVPEQVTENGLRKFLQPYMAKLSIQTYWCQKQRQKRFAVLTFLEPDDGQRFLRTYGQAKPPGIGRTVPTVPAKILILETPIYCGVSNKPSNPYVLRSLAKEKKDQQLKSKSGEEKKKATPTSTFNCVSVSCGVWSFVDSELVFVPYYRLESDGHVKFASRSINMIFTSGKRIDFLYASTYGITTEYAPNPAFTLTLCEAPRFYEGRLPKTMESVMASLARLSITERNGPQRNRIASLDEEHKAIAGSCLIYRIVLARDGLRDNNLIDRIGVHMDALQKAPGMPPIIHQQTDIQRHVRPYISDQKALATELTNSQTFPWKLKFQVLSLTANGHLTSNQALSLLPEIQSMLLRSGDALSIAAVQKFRDRIPYPGPDADAGDFQIKALIQLLRCNEDQVKREEILSVINRSPKQASENMALIHRLTVTPAGNYLYGPDVEPMNRVLRKYPTHHEFFLRVQFLDEDGEPVRFNPRVSNDFIFNDRFKSLLSSGFSIAGRKYDFLGFSHSSLRAQSCWFMAPFACNGSLLYDRMLIQELGDFTKIRCPAKCAARIGQAFSETPTAVSLGPGIVKIMVDVERNGRVFSDGVGTVSTSILHKIWESLPSMQKSKPTCFQIRYQGAKGMISLDSRLKGDQVILRPSMIKFGGSNSRDIELCQAFHKPIPMYLNRQLIKILEDIGVKGSFFLSLQSQEIERLRKITASAASASKFLHSRSIGEHGHLSWLIRKLSWLGLDFRSDRFLSDVLEMSLLMEVRVMKYRARIPVPNGLTLCGIMDETGVLEEGQIFCTFVRDGKKFIITRRSVIITRAPALHPGDVQLVNAVNVPENSPLRKLSNCICFSRMGDRDLPSKLSGGDLDGDLYSIIWDPACRPSHCHAPADYPRGGYEDIGRTVERKDMTDFFIKFMETDQLGRIANSHQILADQRPLGSLDHDCKILAEMHSTAVDFSKTGIPVDMSRMPKFASVRPDFMAPGPNVKIEEKQGLLLEQTSLRTQDENNDDEDFTPYRYYESDKILGVLYRSIDEHEVFSELQKHRKLSRSLLNVMDQVWAYVQHKCALIQWRHYVAWARDIRDMYEDCVLNIMNNYSDHPLRPISELETFIGNILGAQGGQSKRQRDLSVSVKEAYARDAAFVVSCIVDADDVDSDETLERSIACFAVSFEDKNRGGGARKSPPLLSFKYVAAAICLRAVEKVFG